MVAKVAKEGAKAVIDSLVAAKANVNAKAKVVEADVYGMR
jgi:hypothetical protein